MADPVTLTKPAPQPKTVIVMNDGREVAFTSKQKMDKTVVADAHGVALRIDFRNGETVHCVLPETLLAKAAGHGLSQKLGDSVANEDDIDDAVETVRQLALRIESGHWSTERKAGEPKAANAGASLLVKALMEVTGQPADTVREYLATLDAKVKAALPKDPNVAPVYKRLQDERAAKSKKGQETAKATGAALAGLMGAAQPASGDDEARV